MASPVKEYLKGQFWGGEGGLRKTRMSGKEGGGSL